MSDFASGFERNGFALAPNVIAPPEIAILKAFLEKADIQRAQRDGETYGGRDLLLLPEVRRLAGSPAIFSYLLPLLGRDFRAVRGIFFDKTEGANWPVLWHQDLSLAVKERHNLPGWMGWSTKRGTLHVQAPAEVLARMVTIRIHLDDCPAENGALRVIPGSHARGLLTREAIRSIVADSAAETVLAAAGDILFMRPLILHSSSSAAVPSHRRVLHLEFAPADLLPTGLTWAYAA